MEEDIKIIQNKINCTARTRFTEALENLIKGYREKEESEKYLYDAYQDAGKKMFEYAEQLEDSVPKSKIKEKIEELNKIILNARDGESDFILHCCTKKQALEDLMEDK